MSKDVHQPETEQLSDEACEAYVKRLLATSATHPHGRIYFGEKSPTTGEITLRADVSDLEPRDVQKTKRALIRYAQKHPGAIKVSAARYKFLVDEQFKEQRIFQQREDHEFNPRIEMDRSGRIPSPVIRNMSWDRPPVQQTSMGANDLLSRYSG